MINSSSCQALVIVVLFCFLGESTQDWQSTKADMEESLKEVDGTLGKVITEAVGMFPQNKISIKIDCEAAQKIVKALEALLKEINDESTFLKKYAELSQQANSLLTKMGETNPKSSQMKEAIWSVKSIVVALTTEYRKEKGIEMQQAAWGSNKHEIQSSLKETHDTLDDVIQQAKETDKFKPYQISIKIDCEAAQKFIKKLENLLEGINDDYSFLEMYNELAREAKSLHTEVEKSGPKPSLMIHAVSSAQSIVDTLARVHQFVEKHKVRSWVSYLEQQASALAQNLARGSAKYQKDAVYSNAKQQLTDVHTKVEQVLKELANVKGSLPKE